MSKSTLICAATRVEAKACQQGIDQSGLTHVFEICLTGIGLESAARALSARLDGADAGHIARVVSAGFVGAAMPGVRVGAWLLGRGVRGVDSSVIEIESEKLALSLADTGLDWKSAIVTSREKVVSFAAAPPTENLAVDMESLALARIANARAIDFQIFRMVSDTPEEPIPEAITSLVAGVAGTEEPRFLQTLRGTGLALGAPLTFARFLARGRSLPRLLREGWRLSAPTFACP